MSGCRWPAPAVSSCPGRARADRHARRGDAAGRPARRGHRGVRAQLRAAPGDPLGGRHRGRGQHAGPDLARPRPRPDSPAFLPRERRAAARRRRRRACSPSRSPASPRPRGRPGGRTSRPRRSASWSTRRWATGRLLPSASWGGPGTRRRAASSPGRASWPARRLDRPRARPATPTRCARSTTSRRLGEPARGGARRAGAGLDGPFAPAAAAHAAALAARDGRRWSPQPSASPSRARYWWPPRRRTPRPPPTATRAGRRGARTAAARAGLWLAECEGARPPTLLGGAEAAGLTPREREVALLAAAGSSSREIAAALVVSVRTVDNHLQSAYRKLGVTRRQDLPGALAP